MKEKDPSKPSWVVDCLGSSYQRMWNLTRELGKKRLADTLREGLQLVEFLTDAGEEAEDQFLSRKDELLSLANIPAGDPTKGKRRISFKLEGGVVPKVLRLKELRNLDKPSELISLAFQYRELLFLARKSSVPMPITYRGGEIELTELFDR